MLNDTTAPSTTPAVADTPPPEPVKVDTVAAEVESAGDKAIREEEELDDDLRKVFRKSTTPERERDETGKFKSNEPAPVLDKEAKPNTPTKPDAKQTEAKPDVKAEPSKTAIVAPQSWKAEAKAKWDTLPPDVQAYVAERETQAHKQISELGQKASAIDELGKVIEPHRGRMNGTNPTDYINNMFAADAALARDPVDFIKKISTHYGIDLNSLVSDPYAVADPQSAQLSATLNAATARIEQLERQLGEVGHRVIGRETAERQAQQQAFDKTIEDFAADKPDIAELADAMTALMPGLQKANPTASHKEILQSAYESAQWANPKTRQALMDRQAKEAESKRLEAAKEAAGRARRAGSINVRGSTPAMNGHASLDDDLRSVWRRNNHAN